MHPAYSVIFFTTASGAGYGMLVWLAILAATNAVSPGLASGIAAFTVALGLITAGLLSSTFHLGPPERAWRALSQWRSSWLSRDGIAAVVTYAPALFFALGWVVFSSVGGKWLIAGLLAGIMALVTVACTGMIYASLKAVPRWTDATVVPVYLAFATALAWTFKLLYWQRIDNAAPVSTAESATGLGHLGTVRQLEAPHTGENYIMREMGFQIARKHAARLRVIALLIGGAIPVLAFIIAGTVSGPALVIAALIGLVGTVVGVLLERWLFFAEAQHAAMLFYGAKAV